jgi:hypothetical protein
MATQQKLVPLGVLFCLLTACGSHQAPSETSSITYPDWKGSKYYLGWGAAAGQDPSNMHNEVKYDVKHTNDVLTHVNGGSYSGTTLIGTSLATSKNIRKSWNKIASTMTSKDMFFQYSSGHGTSSGLGVGVSYKEMRDRALALDAQETIIFTMACYSGNLVDSFDQIRSQWQDYGSLGKTLLVLSSSQSNQTSATGPGTDQAEAGGPYGSAGSAFGHAVWKGVVGYADGDIDGVKDKKITLGELLNYIKRKTREIGGHTPKMTGIYDPNLVMMLTPSRADLENILGSTPEGRDELNALLQDRIIE